jgi:ABC-type transporter Mla MlaB component
MSSFERGPPGSHSAHSSVTLDIAGPLQRADLPSLFARTCALLAGGGAELLCCQLDERVAADAVAVDALARLVLVARRHSVAVCISGASEELIALVALIGLEEVLRVEPGR